MAASRIQDQGFPDPPCNLVTFVAVMVVPIAAIRLHLDQSGPLGQLALGIGLGAFGEREVEQLHRRIVGEGEEEVEAVGFEGVFFHEHCEFGKGLDFV